MEGSAKPDGGLLRFFPSEFFADDATAAFAEHERRIRNRLPNVEVRHTGGTSISGVLTAGDVDLHVRTTEQSFEAACDALSELYEPYHREVWHSKGAFFVALGFTPRVEVALTVIGSLDDLHHGDAWRKIASDPELVARYNALKRAHEGGSADRYNAAKREFFYENFQL